MALNKPTGDMVNAGSNATPAVLGTASAGTSTSYSRADHVHAKPTPADIGAVATSALSGLATLTAGTLTTTQVAALTGDVTSTAGSPVTKVVALQNSSVSTQSPALGQVLQWNGTAWTPATTTGGGGGGANGLTYYFNQGTAADAPTTGLPAFVKQLGRSGESAGSSVTSATLTTNAWTGIAGFVSESLPIDPDVTSIPAGIWDINAWAFGDANVNAGTSIRAIAYVYNGSTLTTLGTSGTQVINGTSAQYSLSILVQQTAVNLTDRIYIELQAQATASGHTATFQFGDGTPSHAHTSLPLVGGTGLWKSIDGTVQSPASLLVDADVASNAAIAVSKINGAVTTTQLAPYALTSQLANYVATSQLTQLATASGVPQLDGAGKISTVQIPALTTSQITGLDSALASKVNTAQLTQLAVNGGVPQLTTAGTLSTVQIPALTTSQVTGLDAALAGKVSTSQLTTAATANGVPQLTGAGTLSTTQIPALSYQAPLTTASPLALTAGGTGAISAQTAQIAMGGMVLMDWNQTSAVTGTYSTATNTLTYGSNGILTVDGGNPVVGDLVLLSGNFSANTPNNIANGPYVVTDIGSASTPAVLTRPSWFTGTLLSSPYFVTKFGSGQTGVVRTFVGPASSTKTGFTVGTSLLTPISVSARTSNLVLAGGTMTGKLVLNGNTTTTPAMAFQAGVLLTTPVAHSIEWDGTSMYVTNASAVRKRLAQQEDRWTISATASTGVIAFAIDTQEVLYYTSNATADFTLNLTGASTGLNVGASRTVVFLNTNGTTAYKATAFQIDGTAVTPKYQGASITGNASSVDMYSVTIVKTAATPTYSAFVTLTKFA